MQITTTTYKWRASRSIIKGDEGDGQDLDITLAPIILSGLLQYRKALQTRQSMVPEAFLKDLGFTFVSPHQEKFDFAEQAEDLAMWLAGKKWFECVNKIIWAFSYIIANEGPRIQKMDNQADSEYYQDIAYDIVVAQRVQEGLEMFGKYYRNLWV